MKSSDRGVDRGEVDKMEIAGHNEGKEGEEKEAYDKVKVI